MISERVGNEWVQEGAKLMVADKDKHLTSQAMFMVYGWHFMYHICPK